MQAQPYGPIRFSSRAKLITVLAIVVAALYLLSRVSHILLPFIWAIIVAYIFNPLVTLLQQRTRTRRFWWVLLLYIISVGLVFLAVSYLVPLVAEQYNGLARAIPAWLDQAQAYVQQHEMLMVGSIEIMNLREVETEIFNVLKTMATNLPAFVPELLLGVIEGFILMLVFLVVTFYLLLQADTIVESGYQLVPAHHRDEIRQLVGSIDRVLGAYIRGQFLLILIMSVLSFIALSILGIKFALIIAIATGVLEIIPIVGPYLATGIAATVALLQGVTPFGWEPWFLAVVVIIVYFTLRQIEDHFIIPNLVGHIVNLHPIIVIFAILAGGTLAGGLGLLVAIPIAAVIRIILVYLYSKLIDSPTPNADISHEEQALLETPAEAADAEPERHAQRGAEVI